MKNIYTSNKCQTVIAIKVFAVYGEKINMIIISWIGTDKTQNWMQATDFTLIDFECPIVSSASQGFHNTYYGISVLLVVYFENLQALIHTIFCSAPFLFFFCFSVQDEASPICALHLRNLQTSFKVECYVGVNSYDYSYQEPQTDAIWRRPSPPSQIQNHLLVCSPHRRVREDSSSIQKFINAASLQLLLLFGEDISFSMSSNLFCKRKIFVPSLPRLTELWKRMHMGGPCLAWRPFLDNQLHP